MPATACSHLNLTYCLQTPLALGTASHRPESPGAVKDAARDPQSGHPGGSCTPWPPELLGRAGSGQGCRVVAPPGGQEAAAPLPST